MRLSIKGQDFIKGFEGLRLEAYQDVGGVWTIGYGHTQNVYQGQQITKAQADSLFSEDVSSFEDDVNHYVVDKGIVLTQSQFDALVSLVYNVGSHAIFTKVYNNGFFQGSTLYNKLLALDYDGASERFLDFNKVNGQVVSGLTSRRLKESEMFRSKKKLCPQCSLLLRSLLS